MDAIFCVIVAQNHPELDTLRRTYYKWLMDTQQEGKAGELKEKEGDHMAAINLYMKAGMPAQAARVITERPVRILLLLIFPSLFRLSLLLNICFLKSCNRELVEG